MAELKIGDWVAELDLVEMGGKEYARGRVIALGSADDFGIPDCLLAHGRSDPIVRVDWDHHTPSGESVVSLHWVDKLVLLPESREPEEIERWLDD